VSDQKSNPQVRRVGRCLISEEIAAGGMARVHLGVRLGAHGFSASVAVKRLHPFFARDPEVASTLIDEARIAGRVRHPNVVATLDLLRDRGELFVVMEYVEGATLAELGGPLPLDVASAVAIGILNGLHAAHEAKDERGAPLGIVHRDVSPQNVLVGCDGVARVLDFGVAKARGRIQATREGQIKGKLGYMAPEQLRDQTVDRRSDVYSLSVVLWEALTGRRAFPATNEGAMVEQVLVGCAYPPSRYRPEVPALLDLVVMRGLSLQPSKRFATAAEMARAVEEAVTPASASRIGAWVSERAAPSVQARAQALLEVQRLAASEPMVTLGARGVLGRALSALALGLVAVGGALLWRGHASRGAALESPSARPPPILSIATPEAPLAGSAPTPAPTSMTASAVATRAPSASVAPHPPLPVRAPPAASTPNADPDCVVPYAVDETGRRVYKRECL
jgi:serine/threonine-protein kinase